jgi:hypothetical protein
MNNNYIFSKQLENYLPLVKDYRKDIIIKLISYVNITKDDILNNFLSNIDYKDDIISVLVKTNNGSFPNLLIILQREHTEIFIDDFLYIYDLERIDAINLLIAEFFYGNYQIVSLSYNDKLLNRYLNWHNLKILSSEMNYTFSFLITIYKKLFNCVYKHEHGVPLVR